MGADDDGDDGSGSSGGMDSRALLYTVLMVLIGSSTAPSARFAVRELPPGLLPLIRFGVAGLCLLPLLVRQGGLGSLKKMIRTDGKRLAIAALLCIPVNQSFFLNASRLAPTSHVALIYAACPLVVLLLAAALGQERLVIGRLAGILLCVAGVAVIGLDSLWTGGALGRSTLTGDLLLLGAVASWGGYLTVCKPLIARHGPLTALVGVFLTGALMQVPIAVVTMPGWAPLAEASAAAWKGLAFLTLVATVVGLAFQNLAMQRLDASQVATFNNAGPLFTIAWGVWLFGETITPALAVGGVLTLGGIVWANRAARAAAPVSKPVPHPVLCAEG